MDGRPGSAPWPAGTQSQLPTLLALLGAVLMAVGSVCPWADMHNDLNIGMDTDIYPVIRGMMIAAAVGYLGVAAALGMRGPHRVVAGVLLGLGSLGAIGGCLAFIAIGQMGYYQDWPGDPDCAAIYHDSSWPNSCGDPVLTLYDPDIGILLIVLGSLITGTVALWVLAGPIIRTRILGDIGAIDFAGARPPHLGYDRASPHGQTPPTNPTDQPLPRRAGRSRNDLATAALAISLSSVMLCGATAIVGAILGHTAHRQLRTDDQKGYGAALIAIIAGWMLFTCFLILMALFLTANLDLN